MSVIREMEEQQKSIDIGSSQQDPVTNVKSSKHEMRRSRLSKANASQESLEYDLSSDSDGDKSNIEIREIKKSYVTPRPSDVSDAITSDVTKIAVREKGGFDHELASQSAERS